MATVAESRAIHFVHSFEVRWGWRDEKIEVATSNSRKADSNVVAQRGCRSCTKTTRFDQHYICEQRRKSRACQRRPGSRQVWHLTGKETLYYVYLVLIMTYTFFTYLNVITAIFTVTMTLNRMTSATTRLLEQRNRHCTSETAWKVLASSNFWLLETIIMLRY